MNMRSAKKENRVDVKKATRFDAHIGNRIRQRRMLAGLSQDKLADQLGLTFQQVQKYEKGTNRIGAGRLWEVSLILGVPVGYFYEGLDAPLEMDKDTRSGEQDVYAVRDAKVAHDAVLRVQDVRHRKALIAMAEALGEDGR